MTAQAIQNDAVLLQPSAAPADGAALLRWRSDAPDATTAVQVYVDGCLYDVAVDPDQRELWVRLPRSRNVAVELLAVPRDRVWLDHAHELASWDPAWLPSVPLAICRDESLPIDARVVATLDESDEPPHPLWTAGDARAGFGGLFGEGGFGFDDATAPGLGLGEFGAGAFGRDGFAWRWRSRDLPTGSHTAMLRIETRQSDVLAESTPVATEITRPPSAAQTLSGETDFTLRWAIHED